MNNTFTGRISRSLMTLFLILFSAVCGYITWFTFSCLSQAEFLDTILNETEQIILTTAGVLFLALLFYLLVPRLRKLSPIWDLRLCLGVTGILLAGQIILILGIRQSTFMYDPYRVFDEALHMLTTHQVSGTTMEGYYSIYPNNIPFTLICYWITALGSAAGLGDAGLMLLLQILNALCMDTAVLLTARIFQRFISPTGMRIFLILCLFNPLLYLWPGFVYTSTVSMPFIMGGILLFLELFHANTTRGKIRLAAALGVVLTLGFKIRATVLITLIAGVLYFFLEAVPSRNPHPGKQVLGSAAVLFLSMALSLTAWNKIQQQYVNFDTTDTAFPVVSWLAMGLEGDGMFNTADYYDTKNASTAEEKKAINEEKIRSRLSEMGIRGWLDLAGRKLVRTWADGTDDYPSYLNQYSRTGKLHTYVLEDKKDFLVCYMQMMRCFLFLFTTLGAIFMLIRRQNPSVPMLLLQLNLIGGSFFHVLWETGELYSLCFSLLLFALAADGLEQGERLLTWQMLKIKISPFWRLLPCLLLIAGTIAGISLHTDDFIRTPVKKHTSVISQKTYTDAFPEGLTTGNTLTQTFSTDQRFNRVCVRVKNVQEGGKDSQYQITLTDSEDNLYMAKAVTGQDVFDYDYFYLSLDTEAIPRKMTEYTITITCLVGDEDNSIAFLCYDTGNHDAYLPGVLSKNGCEIPKADLNFMVYRSYEDTWMRPGMWYGLCFLLLAAEGILTVLVLRKHRQE